MPFGYQFDPAVYERLDTSTPLMKQPLSLQRLFYLVGLLFLFQVAAYAQPAVSTLKHETQSQQVCVVLFAAPTNGTTPLGDWTLLIGGVPVPGAITSVPLNNGLGRVIINFNLAGLAGHTGAEPYLKIGEALSFSFSNSGNTLKNAAGTTNATPFANTPSTNTWPGDCSDLGFFQSGNIPLAAVNVCSPVVMNFFEYKYYLSLRIRNSTIFGAGNLINEVTWGDGSAVQQVAGYQSDVAGNASATFVAGGALAGNPAVIITSRPTHNYPATLPGTGGDCSWNASVTPALNFAAYTQCGGALTTSNPFATWDNDNVNTGKRV